MGFRIRKARSHRAVLQAALTVFSAEGDIASLHCYRRSSQTTGDLHIAGQVLLTVYIRTVGQLASQCIQHVGYTVFVIHCDVSVVGDERDLGTGSCLGDDGVTRFVVLCRFAISFMCIVDIRIAAVVVDGQAVRILLEDVARFFFALAAVEIAYETACEFVATLYIAIQFIVPYGSIGQPKIRLAFKGIFKRISISILICSFCAKCIVNSACQCGGSGIQSQVDLCHKTLGIRCTYGASYGSCHVALDLHIMSGRRGGIAALIQFDIHIDSAFFCTDSRRSQFIILVDRDLSAAIDRYCRITQNSQKSVAIAADVYVTINDYFSSGSCTLIIRRRRSAFRINAIDISVSPFRACTFSQRFHMTINGDLTVTLCINTIGGSSFVLSVNRMDIHIAFDGQFVFGGFSISLDGYTICRSPFIRRRYIDCQLGCCNADFSCCVHFLRNPCNASAGSRCVKCKCLARFHRQILLRVDRCTCRRDRAVFAEGISIIRRHICITILCIAS